MYRCIITVIILQLLPLIKKRILQSAWSWLCSVCCGTQGRKPDWGRDQLKHKDDEEKKGDEGAEHEESEEEEEDDDDDEE